MSTFTLAELASALGAELHGPANLAISGLCALEEPGPGLLGFVENARQLRGLAPEKVGAVIVPPGSATELPHLVHGKPRLAFARALSLFFPERAVCPGVHPSAEISPEAQVDSSAEVGPFCTVGAGARVGANTRLVARISVGERAEIGSDCQLFPGVVIDDNVLMGDRIVVEPNARIIHGAVIHDDVYIGSRCVLEGCDIGAGTKMDNLSFVGAGSSIGPHNLLISKSHIGRQVTTGPYFLVAAVSCIDDGVEMGPLVQVAGFSRVDRSWTTPKVQLAGDPAQDYKAEIKERSQRLKASKMYAALVAKRKR